MFGILTALLDLAWEIVCVLADAAVEIAVVVVAVLIIIQLF